jgi:predicted transcriptional regulator
VNSFRRSLDCQKQTRVLLSIKPPFATAILQGQKRYEFRRSLFSRRVDTVLMYVTAPVRRVVGEFDVVSIISEPLPRLWRRTREYAGIDEALFYRYFDGLHRGFAIAIGQVRTYGSPFCPVEHLGLRPPQSFVYLDAQKRLGTEGRDVGDYVELQRRMFGIKERYVRAERARK